MVGHDVEHVASQELEGNRISVFASLGLHKVAETCRTATAMTAVGGGEGPASIAAGAVFDVCGMSVGAVSCHYSDVSGEGIAQRTAARNVVTRQLMGDMNARLGTYEGLDLQAQCDHLLWFGDFGYEINEASTGRVEQAVLDCVSLQDFSRLESRDCLRGELAARRTLVGFTEGRLAYPPKLAFRGKPTAWADRVLWCSKAAFRTWLTQRYLAPVLAPPWAAGLAHLPTVASFQLHAPTVAPGADEVFVVLSGLTVSIEASIVAADPGAVFAMRFLSDALPPTTAKTSGGGSSAGGEKFQTVAVPCDLPADSGAWATLEWGGAPRTPRSALAQTGEWRLPCRHSNVSSLGFRHVHLQLRMWSGSPRGGGIPGEGDGVVVGHGSLPLSPYTSVALPFNPGRPPSLQPFTLGLVRNSLLIGSVTGAAGIAGRANLRVGAGNSASAVGRGEW